MSTDTKRIKTIVCENMDETKMFSMFECLIFLFYYHLYSFCY